METFKRFRLPTTCALILIGLVAAGCNTTKATIDTTVNFFSSTTPQNLFTEDGLVAQDQKVNLFVGVGFENLQQDIASGRGEYLTSFEHLLNISPEHHAEFASFMQDHYATLFTSDFSHDRTAHLTTMANLERTLRADARVAQWQR